MKPKLILFDWQNTLSEDGIFLDDDARNLLQHFKTKGVHIGIVSGGDTNLINSALHREGIEVNFVLGNAGKPGTGKLRETLGKYYKRNRPRDDEMVFVGDHHDDSNLVKNYNRYATSTGKMTFVGVGLNKDGTGPRFNNNPSEHQYGVSKLDDVPDKIESIGQSQSRSDPSPRR